MKKVLSFILNGDPVEVLCEDNRSLLDLIRDDLGLTGTKKGCEEAECGACTVMIDGRPVNSCATLAREVEGCEVITVEGVAKTASSPRCKSSSLTSGPSSAATAPPA